MTTDPFHFPSPFAIKSKVKTPISLCIVKHKNIETVLKGLSDIDRTMAEVKDVSKDSKAAVYLPNKKCVLVPCSDKPGLFDFAALHDEVKKVFASSALKGTGFILETHKLSDAELNDLYIGWGMASYSFKITKKARAKPLCLIWSKGVDQKRVKAFVESISLLRNLVNIPTIDMGPDELQKASEDVGTSYKATVKVIKGKKLEKDFPLVHAVGMASHRAPRLIEMNWGNKKHPQVCLVGKGVCFDTGGLDIKPSQFMRYMKKDMGGAAHALALANLIMALNLPVRLRLLIPAVENAVAAEAFRPGDVFISRKGLSVENTNTDAEGRLILADSLTYGSEDKPDLLIDFATLTGSARAALGQDIPAMFSSDEKIAKALQKSSIDAEDPLWAMPLWTPYQKLIESSVADLHNSAGVPGDLIYSALFLHSFVENETPWVHIDTFAWESAGRPGRAKGAMDMGLRSVFAYLEQRYG